MKNNNEKQFIGCTEKRHVVYLMKTPNRLFTEVQHQMKRNDADIRFFEKQINK